MPRGLVIRAVLAGSHPEPKDVPLELELEAVDSAALGMALAALARDHPAFGGRLEVLALSGPARVRLVAPPGTRVSVGRFLEALRGAVAGGLLLTRVHRRLTTADAWQGGATPLPSPAPFSSDEERPCTQ